jgi:hypothetical protein
MKFDYSLDAYDALDASIDNTKVIEYDGHLEIHQKISVGQGKTHPKIGDTVIAEGRKWKVLGFRHWWYGMEWENGVPFIPVEHGPMQTSAIVEPEDNVPWHISEVRYE